MVLNDPSFPKVRLTEASKMLTGAASMLEDKLSVTGIEFRLREGPSPRQFVERHAPLQGACMRKMRSYSVNGQVGSVRAADMPRGTVSRYLQRWSLSELQSWFHAETPRPASYEAVVEAILAAMDQRVESIRKLRLPDGSPLLDDTASRLFTGWICALEAQDDADVIITNTFIMFDFGAGPAPHSVLTANGVSGASLRSPQRRAMDGRAIFASTFALTTGLAGFYTEPRLDPFSDEFCAVFSTSLLAHELGHGLLKIPDFYDHPPACLMSTRHGFSHGVNHAQMLANRGPCAVCAPYLQAYATRRRAQAFQGAGDGEAAIAAYRRSIELLPRFVDGVYETQVAPLYRSIAELLYERGDYRQAAEAALDAAKGGPSPKLREFVQKASEAYRAQRASRKPPPPSGSSGRVFQTTPESQ